MFFYVKSHCFGEWSDYIFVMMKKFAVEKNHSTNKKKSIFEEVLGSISRKKIINLKKNEHLYRQNEPIKGIYYLKKGKIKVVQKDKDEKYNILNSIKGPDLIGLSSILCDDVHLNSAYSVEDSNILFISKKEFFDILHRNNKIALDLMKFLCVKIDKTEAKIPQIIE
jgi:CRP-like cAMP-binding protein